VILDHLKIEKFHFEIKLLDDIRLPFFAGSMLRGAFGHALRKVACMTKQRDCKACPLYFSCPYTQIFEAPPPESSSLQKFSQIPNPYIIQPPVMGERIIKKGGHFSFEMTLIGQSIEQLSLIIFAWQKACMFGLSKTKSRAKLLSVTHCSETRKDIWTHGNEKLLPYIRTDILPANIANVDEVNILIDTPLRIQKQGKPSGVNEITARDLLITLIRRISLISEFHHNKQLKIDFSKLNKKLEKLTSEKDLKWCDWERYSNRQKQPMKLGGMIGRWRIKGELDDYFDFLRIGEKIHVGKNTTFGLGHYSLV